MQISVHFLKAAKISMISCQKTESAFIMSICLHNVNCHGRARRKFATVIIPPKLLHEKDLIISTYPSKGSMTSDNHVLTLQTASSLFVKGSQDHLVVIERNRHVLIHRIGIGNFRNEGNISSIEFTLTRDKDRHDNTQKISTSNIPSAPEEISCVPILNCGKIN